MTNDSGEKPREFWILPQKGNDCDWTNLYPDESWKSGTKPLIHVREVTPCPNCERLEAYKEQTKHAVDINQKMVADRDAEIQHLQKQLEMCKEALTLIAAPKRNDGTHNRCREACEQLAVKCLKAIDKEFGE